MDNLARSIVSGTIYILQYYIELELNEMVIILQIKYKDSQNTQTQFSYYCLNVIDYDVHGCHTKLLL